MKYLQEYRDPELAQKLLDKIFEHTNNEWVIMEFCGGQTHSLIKHGIVELLPKQITMLHGPGCPVCVTSVDIVDKAIELAEKDNVILCAFGDMLRVPGSEKNLLEAKAVDADIRILYSPLEAIEIARKNPEKEVVFFGIGFETTAPANALSVIHAKHFELSNYSLLSSHVLVPPAMEAVINDPLSRVDGFLGAGHVCSVMGLTEYERIVKTYKLPIVVTGFEPVDLLQGILMTVLQLEEGRYDLENQYSRVVPQEGNSKARKVIEDVFEITDREWRGMGTLENSGWKLKPTFSEYDAFQKFNLKETPKPQETECIAGEVLKGQKKPKDCPHFGKKCTPIHPLGAPMVSSEGACAAYYHFSQLATSMV